MSRVRKAVLADQGGLGFLSKSFLGDLSVGSSIDIRRDMPTPMLTVDTDSIVNNIEEMARWAAQNGVQLAPHGKTTMTPTLWNAQLVAGAVGITVANFSQARVAADAGVPMIIIANEFLTPPGVRWLRSLLNAPSPEVMCWVDSVAAVERMQDVLHDAPRQVSVCVELGVSGERTGVRDDVAVGPIVESVRGAAGLSFAGFAGFEGVLPGERIAEVRGFLQRMADLFEHYGDQMQVKRPFLTAGGSIYFDLVAEILKPAAEKVPGAQTVLRAGSYVLHDDLHHAHLTPLVTRGEGPELVAAATLWARVISLPESNLAILDVGKRDLAYDVCLPQPRKVHGVSGGVEVLENSTLVNTNDQHAYLSYHGIELEVGDLLELGQAHACTIADKWREIPLVTSVAPGQLRLDGKMRTHF